MQVLGKFTARNACQPVADLVCVRLLVVRADIESYYKSYKNEATSPTEDSLINYRCNNIVVTKYRSF